MSNFHILIESRDRITRQKCVICSCVGGGCDRQFRVSKIGRWVPYHSVCAEKVKWGKDKPPKEKPPEAERLVQNGVLGIASAFLGTILGDYVVGNPVGHGFGQALRQLQQAKEDEGEEEKQEAKVIDVDYEVIDKTQK